MQEARKHQEQNLKPKMNEKDCHHLQPKIANLFAYQHVLNFEAITVWKTIKLCIQFLAWWL